MLLKNKGSRLRLDAVELLYLSVSKSCSNERVEFFESNYIVSTLLERRFVC